VVVAWNGGTEHTPLMTLLLDINIFIDIDIFFSIDYFLSDYIEIIHYINILYLLLILTFFFYMRYGVTGRNRQASSRNACA